ncbi:glycosyltransferase family 2 protein [Campylobacter fetus]|uniref:glycosyltransferase family 2 protein n=1 Tax=Campylobacter fetus TaxID=196 RepID=UPI0013D36F35|nr:glycosyltransferase [Campylobacter fetus]
MFSIVITTYNRSKLLKRCLDSIKNQTFNQYEVLILDDCSSDDTNEMVKNTQIIVNLCILKQSQTMVVAT